MLLGQCRSEIKMWLCLIGLRLQLRPLLVDQLVEVTSENIVLSIICCGLLAGTLFVYFFQVEHKMRLHSLCGNGLFVNMIEQWCVWTP